MPSLQSILSVLIAGFALSATPGPSMLYVLSHSIGQSRAAGLASAFGLCLGGIVLAIATAFGLAAVFASFDWLIIVLRYVGSAYLVWLGVGMILHARSDARAELTVRAANPSSLTAIFRQGVLVEMLNPKTVLFFALFLPPFVRADAVQQDAGSVTLQLLILGSLVPLTAVPSDIIVAVLGGAMAKTIDSKKAVREVMGWIGGLLLILIALSLHLEIF